MQASSNAPSKQTTRTPIEAPSLLRRLAAHEELNFLLTNRIPRIALTRFMGWFSKIETPWVRDLSIAVWKRFADLDLSDAKKTQFTSLHDCFTRELVPGARTINTAHDVLVSPCDAIVGQCGDVEGTKVFQAKGFPYEIAELLASDALAEEYRDGTYVTLRLTSSMYHRFHSPGAAHITAVDYISGDVWNVNPPALARVEKLYCRNERAIVHMTLKDSQARLLLVPVAAVLVASMRFHFANVLFHVRYSNDGGANHIPCDQHVTRGEELGWFEHGSTIIVFAPKGFTLAEGIAPGHHIRMGEQLLTLPK
jgi:phosphatidylserine decarboxylase